MWASSAGRDLYARHGAVGEVSGHDGGRAAIEREGALDHPAQAKRYQVRQSVGILLRQDRQGITLAGLTE